VSDNVFGALSQRTQVPDLNGDDDGTGKGQRRRTRKVNDVRISVRVRGAVYDADMPVRNSASLVVDAR
jgi:hypothetical protein